MCTVLFIQCKIFFQRFLDVDLDDPDADLDDPEVVPVDPGDDHNDPEAGPDEPEDIPLLGRQRARGLRGEVHSRQQQLTEGNQVFYRK